MSVCFSWDREEGLRLARAWENAWGGLYAGRVRVGGPAFGDPGGDFTPGQYVSPGYVITTRGCPRRCSFCLVPEREGRLRELRVTDGRDVLDNNVLAASQKHLDQVFAMLRRQGRPIKLSGGLDPCFVTSAIIDEYLRTVRIERVFTAYDEPGERDVALGAIALLRKHGLSRRQVGCYVLVARDDDTRADAENRCREVWAAGGEPFAMLYRDDSGSKGSREWQHFQRKWCRPAAYNRELRLAQPSMAGQMR